MRQLMSWRTWAAVGLLVALVVVVRIVNGGDARSSRDDDAAQPSIRQVETVASVMNIDASEAFSVVEGVTVGSAAINLDDGRTVSITRGTPGEIDCTDQTTPAACVLLADMLGEGVVWYALVNADSIIARTLVLPTLVDMVDGGDTGVLANGWQVPLANGVIRTCAGEPRSTTLRAFIESYSEAGIRTVLDLDRDEVVEVICDN